MKILNATMPQKLILTGLKVLSCLYGLALVSSDIWADVHPVKATAGIEIVSNDTMVNMAMISEEVTLNIRPTLMHVHVVFLLRSEQTAYDSLWIGFPDNQLEDFVAKVDGEKVSVFKKKWRERNDEFDSPNTVVVAGKKYRKVKELLIELSEYFESSSNVFQISINAGQTKRVEIEYFQKLHYFPYWWPLTDSLEFYGGYIFKTGKAWKGSIGKAVINVNVLGVPLDRLQFKFPFKPVVTNSGYRFEIFDWEPEVDFEYRLTVLRKEIIAMEMEPLYSTEALPMEWRIIDRLIRISQFHYFKIIDSLIKKDEPLPVKVDFKASNIWMNTRQSLLYDSLRKQIKNPEWEKTADLLIGLAKQDSNLELKKFANNALKNIRNGIVFWYKQEINPVIEHSSYKQYPRLKIVPEIWIGAMTWFSNGEKTEEDSILHEAMEDSAKAEKLYYRIDAGFWYHVAHAFVNVTPVYLERIKVERDIQEKRKLVITSIVGCILLLSLALILFKNFKRPTES